MDGWIISSIYSNFGGAVKLVGATVDMMRHHCLGGVYIHPLSLFGILIKVNPA